MRRSLLSRLRSNGFFYLISALLLLLGIPFYQAFVLTPQGYNSAITTEGTGRFSTSLTWMSAHGLQFVFYRGLLALAFALLLTLPFTLYRIIVAQELMGQQERAEEVALESDDEAGSEQDEEDETRQEGMPPFAWRGKGFAVLAAWAGLIALIIYVLGIVAGTLYLFFISRGFTAQTPVPDNFVLFNSIFSLATNTVAIGLLALATLFFGAMIARSGRNLWPGSWVAFAYMALAVAALLSGSAVGVASSPTTGQAALTSPAILLFALWVLWLGIMLVRLKPEG